MNGVKVCNKCGVAKPVGEFTTVNQGDGRHGTCQGCRNVILRARRLADREAVFGHYGRSCECCGSATWAIVGRTDGCEGQGGQRPRGAAFYRWLIASGFPDGLQPLCRSCSASRRGGDRCRLDHTARQAA